MPAVATASIPSSRMLLEKYLWALAELVEAAVRCGKFEPAAAALERLRERTQAADTEWALGIEARSRALVTSESAGEEPYRETIERLGRCRVAPEQARAHLRYGEWLRREGRRVDAREQLRVAHGMLTAIGMGAFGERARRELEATGAAVRKRRPETRDDLTAQRRRSRDSPGTATPIRRPRASSSCARAPSSGTCARCSRARDQVAPGAWRGAPIAGAQEWRVKVSVSTSASAAAANPAMLMTPWRNADAKSPCDDASWL
jgi:hypothetical protein